ncbi:MAG: CBS domain-containing protein [Acidobacteriota bacterium]
MDKVDRLLGEKGREVFTVKPDTTVFDAVRMMTDRHIGGVVVASEGVPVGMFTERDVLTKIVLACRDPKTCRVEEVMTRDVVYVTPETTIGEAMAIMTTRRHRHLPVMNGKSLMGLVSIGDCTRWVSRNQDFTIKHLINYIADKYPT